MPRRTVQFVPGCYYHIYNRGGGAAADLLQGRRLPALSAHAQAGRGGVSGNRRRLLLDAQSLSLVAAPRWRYCRR